MSEKRSSRKKAISLVQNILALVLMILIAWWALSNLTFMMTQKIGGWYNYTFVISSGILSIIVGIALIKELLIFVLKQRREGSSTHEETL